MVQSPIIESLEKATVDVLIEPKSKRWNDSVIDGIFVPQEAEIIKKIPLAWVDYKDVIYLPLSQNGVYTCKAGYRFLKEEEISP